MTIRPPKMTTAKITAAEQARRQKALDFSRASVGLEGFKPGPDFEAAAKKHVLGQINLDEFIREVRASCGITVNG